MSWVPRPAPAVRPVSGGFLVMAMAMEELAIPVAVLSAQHARPAVVDLDDLLQVRERPPTPGAPPVLPPEHARPTRGSSDRPSRLAQ